MTAGFTAELVAVDEAQRLEPDTLHLVCACNEDRGMCGTDVTDATWTEEGDVCVVCEDLVMRTYPRCPRCGRHADDD